MEASQNEKARLMANLKLLAKRSLRKSINLEYLANDPEYARICLAEIEDATDDEALLILIVRLRELLLAPPEEKPQPPVPEETKPDQGDTLRTCRFGARSW